MLTAITKDLKNELNSIDESVQNEENHVRILKQFSDFIQFHSESKQLSNQQSIDM